VWGASTVHVVTEFGPLQVFALETPRSAGRQLVEPKPVLLQADRQRLAPGRPAQPEGVFGVVIPRLPPARQLPDAHHALETAAGLDRPPAGQALAVRREDDGMPPREREIRRGEV